MYEESWRNIRLLDYTSGWSRCGCRVAVSQDASSLNHFPFSETLLSIMTVITCKQTCTLKLDTHKLILGIKWISGWLTNIMPHIVALCLTNFLWMNVAYFNTFLLPPGLHVKRNQHAIKIIISVYLYPKSYKPGCKTHTSC